MAVCGLKTQLRFTISLPLDYQKTWTLRSLLAYFLRSTCSSLRTLTGSERRLSLPSFGRIVFASLLWKMPLPTAWSDFSLILVLHSAVHSNFWRCGIWLSCFEIHRKRTWSLVTPFQSDQAVLLRQHRAFISLLALIFSSLPVFVTMLKLQTCFFSCPIILLPNLIC